MYCRKTKQGKFFHFSFLFSSLSAGFLLLSCTVFPASASQNHLKESEKSGIFPHHQSNLSPFGIEENKSGLLTVRKNKVVICVQAVNANVFRVRIGRNGQLPPDESWAVPADIRKNLFAAQTDKTKLSLKIPGGILSINSKTGAVDIRPVKDAPAILDQGKPFENEKDGFRLVKNLDKDAHIFGLGDKNAPLDQRGYVHQNWNTDPYFFQERQEPLYKDIPFFMIFEHGKASGIFMDNTFRSVFDFGVSNLNEMRFGADGGFIDYYVMMGPTPADVIRQYSDLTGKAALPPKWAFGYHQSRYSYGDENKVKSIVRRFQKDHIPADAIWLDIDFQDQKRPFTVNRKAFPDFEKMVSDLKKEGIQTVAITDLHVAKLSSAHYMPYDKGHMLDVFAHNPDGSEYVGKVWPGDSVFPDFTDAKARKYWGDLYTESHLKEVAGFWNDMNEPSVFNGPGGTMPLDIVHQISSDDMTPRKASHAEIHNVFGMENARATHDGVLRLHPTERPFVMTRASYAGGQRYSVTWTGDNSSTWNSLRLSTPVQISLGLSGFPFVGANIGGFTGSPSPELLTEWIELGMFTPIADNHSDSPTRDQEPWVDGKKQENIRKRYIQERYRLMPYIYTLAENASQTGEPMMRALFYQYPDASADGYPLDRLAPGEFMFGPDLLVAKRPFVEQVDNWNVILPPGEWFDYWTNKKVTNTQEASGFANSGISIALKGNNIPHKLKEIPKLDHLPVYVRAGSVIPHQPLVMNTAQKPSGPLELSVYAAPRLSGSVYDDDGHTFAFEQGEYFKQNFSGNISGSNGKGTLTLEAPTGHRAPWWQEMAITIYGISKPKMVTLNDAKVKFSYQPAQKSLTLKIKRTEKEAVLRWTPNNK
ncbi:DUF5110 domain-containing protein [Acetobacteraceae bacterium]|nr:DUF5110 domain-containing protein [Acetobacteraceae bacterium]